MCVYSEYRETAGVAMRVLVAVTMRVVVALAAQHRHHLDGVEKIRFGAAFASADFNRRGVDDDVLNSLMHQEAMDPQAVAAGLVARHERGVGGEPEPEFGLLDFAHDEAGAATRNRADPGRLASPENEGHLPRCPAQLKSHAKHGSSRRGRMNCVSR
jgi:hypothetical protein